MTELQIPVLIKGFEEEIGRLSGQLLIHKLTIEQLKNDHAVEVAGLHARIAELSGEKTQEAAGEPETSSASTG